MMKRSLLAIFLTAILALCGCSKVAAPQQSGEVVAVFDLAIDEPSAKAGLENGHADAVNRYIMEVYPAGSTDLYERVEKLVEPGTTFTEIAVSLLVGMDYNFVLWADCANEDGSDLYYSTDSPLGLRDIGIMSTKMPCNEDRHDAFTASVIRTAGADLGQTIWLRRPFAQLNVITTDMSDINRQQLLPSTVTLRYTGWEHYDAMNAVPAGDRVVFEHQAQPYYKLGGNSTTEGTWILAMDYILAPKNEAKIEIIDFLVSTEAEPLPWNRFDNIPLKANYRTNISGSLMTFNMSYNVVIAPSWDGEL